MILLFFYICMHLLQQSAKERCSRRQFLLKLLTVVRIFRPPKAEVQSDTSWCILFRTVTPSCSSGALSLTERSKSPFSVVSFSLGLSSVASTQVATATLRYSQASETSAGNWQISHRAYIPTAGCQEIWRFMHLKWHKPHMERQLNWVLMA